MQSADDCPTRVLESDQLLEIPPLVFTVVEGPNKGLRFEMRGRSVRVGTAPACELKLDDPTVSRVHCEISCGKDGLRIVDLESTNGTVVDGVRVEAARIGVGARVAVGKTVLVIGVGAEPVLLPLPARVRFGQLVGGSVDMRQIYAIVERVAPSNATVLVEGETGTGKELVARAVHEASPRADGPFVVVDCAAIAESLIESELFGHMRGAFSGAVADREGLFEVADGGTLFLDEVGELPSSLQPKLLRALERREVRRVGSNTTRTVDVRVVAATNRELARQVNEGSFREDLYYRLAVVPIRVPPLRARREDILLLARHFYAQFAGKEADFPIALAAGLLTRGWPGNVRELRNYIERAVSLGVGPGSPGTPAAMLQIPTELEALVPVDLPLKEARDRWGSYLEHLYVRAILRKTRGNVSQAARLAGVNRRWMHRLMDQVGVRESVDDAEPDRST